MSFGESLGCYRVLSKTMELQLSFHTRDRQSKPANSDVETSNFVLVATLRQMLSEDLVFEARS